MSFRTLMPLSVVLLLSGCGGDAASPGGSGGATASGIVSSANTGTPLAGATVSAGTRTSTTDADGSYELTGLPAGSVTLAAAKDGYEPYSLAVVLTDGANDQDVALTRKSVFQLSTVAVYVPPQIAEVRGVILGLGGFDTRLYATNQPAAGVPAEVTQGQIDMRAQLLGLAVKHSFAIGGAQVLRDEELSDAKVINGLAELAALSDRPELALAPVLLFGHSGGAPESFGFPLRQPARAIGYAGIIGSMTFGLPNATTRAIPGYIILGELDTDVNNADWTTFFQQNRAEGAIWALAVVPGVGHISLDDRGRSALIAWMDAAISLRVPASVPSGTAPVLMPLSPSDGWLGNNTSQEIAGYALYSGDPLTASWLPTEAAAEAWQTLVTVP